MAKLTSCNTIKKCVFNYDKSEFPELTEEQLENLRKVEIVFGDITKIHCDAIVNSASKTLRCGGGVDLAIHKAAGPKLTDECAKLGGCKTGEAKITKAYKLPCKKIIHTVGPVYSREDREEISDQLASCYYNSMKLADENILGVITFPAISNGIFGFPTRLSLPIVITTVSNALSEFKNIKQVNLICHSPIQYTAYTSYFEEVKKLALTKLRKQKKQ